MSRSTIIAIAASLAIHAILAVAIVGWRFSDDSTQIELDLSKVELNLTEDAADKQSAASFDTPSAQRKILTPHQIDDPPDAIREIIKPRDKGESRLREPELTITKISEASRSDTKPKQARIDAPATPRRAIRPNYPRGSRQRGEEGNVVLKAEVEADGNCTAAEIITSSGFAELDKAAANAVKQARFNPATADGKSVRSTTVLTIVFRLK